MRMSSGNASKPCSVIRSSRSGDRVQSGRRVIGCSFLDCMRMPKDTLGPALFVQVSRSILQKQGYTNAVKVYPDNPLVEWQINNRRATMGSAIHGSNCSMPVSLIKQKPG